MSGPIVPPNKKAAKEVQTSATSPVFSIDVDLLDEDERPYHIDADPPARKPFDHGANDPAPLGPDAWWHG